MADGPTFFKKLRRITVAFGITGAALIAAQAQYPEAMNFINVHIGGYMIAISVAGTFITSLTVSDPNNNPKVD